MSVVISLGAQIFHKRAEEAVKNSPIINCLGNTDPDLSDILIYTHPDSDETYFFKDEESRLYLMLGIKVSQPPFTVNAHLQLRLTAEPDEDDTQAFRLKLAYHDTIFQLGNLLSDEDKEKLDDAAKDQLNPILADFTPIVPLGSLLATDAELVDMPLLRIPGVDMTSDDRVSDSTLVIGLEFSTDNGVDRDAFMEDFTANPRGSAAWHLSVDDRLILARVNEVLAQIDFTQDAEDGVENWIATTETRAFWTGDNVNGQMLMPWHDNFVTENMSDHPIWFKVIGFYDMVVVGLATESYALGYADFSVETDDDGVPQITVTAHLFAAGSGFIPIEITDDDQPAPTHVAPAEVAPGLSVSEFSYGEEFLACTGTDSHPGLPGNARIQVADSLSLVLDTSTVNPCGGIMAYSQSAHLYGQSTVAAGLPISNTGEAPLWICGISFVDPDDVFELSTNAQFPVSLPAGESVVLNVHYNSPDSDPHSGQLVITCNDVDERHYSVALTGRLYGGLHPSVASGMGCFEKPENIPPQEWFENLGGMLRDVQPYVDGTITPDHTLEVRITGLSPDALVHVLDGRGTILSTSVYAEKAHHLSIPNTAESVKVEGKSVNRSMSMLMSVSRAVAVGRFESDVPPTAVAQDHRFVYAAFKDHVAIVSLHDPEKPTEVAALPLQNVESIRLSDQQLIVSTERELHVVDVSDPYTPTIQHRMRSAAFDVHGKHLVVADKASMRVYELRIGSSPRLEDVIHLTATPKRLEIERYGKGLVLASDTGNFSVRSLSRVDLAHAKPVRAAQNRSRATAVRQFQLEIRPNKERGGFDLIRQRFGDVRLHTGRIEKQLSRRRR
ncbi:MAG: hypothetical protein CL607_07485 [Anaerolineaceae bacterium]|nr:hypothetical protein [Anaerolineaceae bacterium]